MSLLAWVKRYFDLFARRKPGWPDPPKNEDHATYRDQYEKLLPVLKGLPRGDNFEERKAYLFLAELLIGLHNYGDDPIMPPGVRRIIERVTAEELPPVLVRRTPGPVASRFLGPVAANPIFALLFNPITWIVALVAFCGVQMGLKEHIENQRDEARADVARLEHSREAYARELSAERAAHATDVAQVLENTAETVEQIQRQRARERAREARERSRHEDLDTGSIDLTERLRELARPEGERLPAISAPTPSGDPAGAMPTSPDPTADNGDNP